MFLQMRKKKDHDSSQKTESEIKKLREREEEQTKNFQITEKKENKRIKNK